MPPTFSSGHAPRIVMADSRRLCARLKGKLLEIYDFFELNCDPGSDNDKSICNMHKV